MKNFTLLLYNTIESRLVLKDTSNLGSITSLAVNEILPSQMWKRIPSSISADMVVLYKSVLFDREQEPGKGNKPEVASSLGYFLR